MVEPRLPVTTVGFVDDYCNHYQDLFADVRNFEAFKFLVLGMISELPRKSLPAIARRVGLLNAQSLHHFLQRTPLQVEQFRTRRLELIKQLVGERSLLIQPFIFWCLLESWLHVFPIPRLKHGFFKLMANLNNFRAFPITYAQLNSA